MPHTHPSDQEPHGEAKLPALENNHTPWKTVQTRWFNTHGRFGESPARGKLYHQDFRTSSKPREIAPSTDPPIPRSPLSNSVTGQVSKGSAMTDITAGSHWFEVAMHGQNPFLLLPCDPDLDCMQESPAERNTCLPQVSDIPLGHLHGEGSLSTHQVEPSHIPPMQ